MAAEVFFEHGNVKIDRALAKFQSTSYPIANIGSVSIREIGPGIRAPLGVLIALSGFIVAVAGKGAILGAGIILAGVVLYIKARPKFAIILRTSSGDQQAFESTNKSLVVEVMAALEAAITARD